MRKIISNPKTLIIFLVIVFSFFSNTIAPPNSGITVNAQSSSGMDSIDILKNYQLLEWLLKCESKDTWKITGEIGKDSGASEHTFLQAPGGAITESEEPVGHIAAEETGTRECNSIEGTEDMFKAIGYTFKEWRDEFYVFSDDTLSVGEYDIKDGSDEKMVKIWEEKRDYWKAEYGKVKQVQYIALLKAFKKGCEAKEVDESLKSGKNTVDINNYTEVDGTQKGPKYFEVGDESGSIAVGYGLDADGGSDGKMTCSTIASQMNKLSQAWADYKKTDAGQDDSSSIDAGDDTTKPNCESSITNVGWIICPVIDGAFAIMRVVEGAVVGQLKFTLDDIGGDPTTDANTTQKIKQSHGSILLISNYLFAIGILWIVISQAITGGAGGGFFGAYEAKKILPKLIAGIFVANVSWELVNLLLIITNAIGDSIKSIMLAPFEGATNLAINFNNGSDLLLVGVGAGLGIGLAIFGFFAVSPLLIMVLIAVLSAIIFSVLRKGMIIVLVIFAPIMLALSPFMPNIFKRYYKLLLNVILFYIVVMVSIAAFTIIGYIIFQGAGGGNSSATSIGQSLTKLIGIAFYFGWMFPVLAFAKNNFDVVGKVGGSLQGWGNKQAKGFGQNRLEGNNQRIKRKLLADARKQDKAKSAYRNLVKNAMYEPKDGDGRLKRGVGKLRAGYIKNRQAEGSILTPSGRAKREKSKAAMVRKLAGQDEELSLKAGQEALSVESVSSFDPSAGWDFKDAKGETIPPPKYRDHKGKMQDYNLENNMDLQRAIADGHTVSYGDVAGDRHTLSGQDSDIRFAAAMALGQAGDVSQIRSMASSQDEKTRKLAAIAVSSNAGAFIAKAPDLTSKPNRIAFGGGLTYGDVSGWHGSTVEKAVDFQSQTSNFLGDKDRQSYEEYMDSARQAHVASGLSEKDAEKQARSDANTWAGNTMSSEWKKAAEEQGAGQTALMLAMNAMKNDPRRNDTKNLDKIKKYEDGTGIRL